MVLCFLCGGQHVVVLPVCTDQWRVCCCVLCREWWALHKALCTTSVGERQLVSNWSADTLTWWVT